MKIAQLFQSKQKPEDLDIAPPYCPEPQNVKIRMSDDARGASDHIHMMLYQQGQEYTVTENLARLFIEMGVAELLKK